MISSRLSPPWARPLAQTTIGTAAAWLATLLLITPIWGYPVDARTATEFTLFFTLVAAGRYWIVEWGFRAAENCLQLANRPPKPDSMAHPAISTVKAYRTSADGNPQKVRIVLALDLNMDQHKPSAVINKFLKHALADLPSEGPLPPESDNLQPVNFDGLIELTRICQSLTQELDRQLGNAVATDPEIPRREKIGDAQAVNDEVISSFLPGTLSNLLEARRWPHDSDDDDEQSS